MGEDELEEVEEDEQEEQQEDVLFLDGAKPVHVLRGRLLAPVVVVVVDRTRDFPISNFCFVFV